MRLSGWKLPLERLSVTSMSTFASCPEQFRQKYILNTPEKMSGDRFMGSVHHEALQRLFQLEGTQAIPSFVVDQAWQEIIERDGEPEWHDVDATDSYKRAQKMIETYWPTAKETKPVAVEQRFEETIAGYTISGYIDLELEDRIREVKTTDKKQSKPKSRHRFQARTYSLVSEKPVEWHYVTRQVTPKVYTPKDEGCEELYVERFNPDVTVRMIHNLIAQMNDTYFRYGKDQPWPLNGTFGDWTCNYCSFKKNCIAWG